MKNSEEKDNITKISKGSRKNQENFLCINPNKKLYLNKFDFNSSKFNNECNLPNFLSNFQQRKKSNFDTKYTEPEKWIKVKNKNTSENYLKELCYELKQIDPSLNYSKIGKIIHCNFRGYVENQKMKEETFQNLKKFVKTHLNDNVLFYLYKRHQNKPLLNELELYDTFKEEIIPHMVYIGKNGKTPYIALEKNELTAEFLAIMEGDGSLKSNGLDTTITLNGIDEPRYVKYVKEKILDRLFIINPFKLISIKNSKAVRFKNGATSVHYAIKEIGKGFLKTGLVPGDKVKNKIDITDWIYISSNYMIKTIKGLFDTDGYISVKYGSFILGFSNSSKPLVQDFYDICRKLGIVSEKKLYLTNKDMQFVISKTSSIRKFLEIVKPEKFREPGRRVFLGSKILYLNAPLEINFSVKMEINNWRSNEDTSKRFTYTLDNAKRLKKCIEKYYNSYLKKVREFDNFLLMTYEVKIFLSETTIIESFTNRCVLKRSNYFVITKNLIDTLLNFGLIVERYYGIKFLYDKEKSEVKIHQFPSIIKKELCNYIYSLLKDNPNLSEEILLEYIIYEFMYQNHPKLYDLLKFLKYNINLIKYFRFLIKIIREFLRRLNTPNLRKTATAWHIIKYFNDIEHSRWKSINSIIKDLME